MDVKDRIVIVFVKEEVTFGMVKDGIVIAGVTSMIVIGGVIDGIATIGVIDGIVTTGVISGIVIERVIGAKQLLVDLPSLFDLSTYVRYHSSSLASALSWLKLQKSHPFFLSLCQLLRSSFFLFGFLLPFTLEI